MFQHTVIYLDDDDFASSDRDLADLKPEVRQVASTAYMIVYRDRVLKNRLGAAGEIGQRRVS